MDNKSLDDVLLERLRQDALWGEQNHELIVWISILMEEVGEFAQEVLETKVFQNRFPERFTEETLREEAVQVAAVALAIVECIDRNNIKS
jgi:NTP pyrophosphatase (non-canonical NTP hydrolase)